MPQDFKHGVGRMRRSQQGARLNRKLLATFAGGIVITLALLGPGRNVSASVNSVREEWLTAEPSRVLDAAESERRTVLQRGDTAASALQRLGFAYRDVAAMIEAAHGMHALKDVRAGRAVVRRQGTDAQHVLYAIDGKQVLHLWGEEGRWQAEIKPRVTATREVVRQGEIRDNLFVDAAAAGLGERTTMNLVDIFAWDIDFARDLRQGDAFRVVVREQFDRDGRLLASTILAAEFVNRGEMYSAVRFQLADGRVEYFAPDGKSMRKAYLKSPVKFSRISSRFTSRRKHPILGYTRAHRGVDYASPSGTPVHAVGDGTVVYAGWRGGYGRYVKIRHKNADHTTVYAHLRRFGRHIHKGRRVHQGDVIGYVGMSGLATGPHLHFEFHVRGRAVNPLSIERRPASPVPQAQWPQFVQVRNGHMARLQHSPVMLAWG